MSYNRCPECASDDIWEVQILDPDQSEEEAREYGAEWIEGRECQDCGWVGQENQLTSINDWRH